MQQQQQYSTSSSRSLVSPAQFTCPIHEHNPLSYIFTPPPPSFASPPSTPFWMVSSPPLALALPSHVSFCARVPCVPPCSRGLRAMARSPPPRTYTLCHSSSTLQVTRGPKGGGVGGEAAPERARGAQSARDLAPPHTHFLCALARLPPLCHALQNTPITWRASDCAGREQWREEPTLASRAAPRRGLTQVQRPNSTMVQQPARRRRRRRNRRRAAHRAARLRTSCSGGSAYATSANGSSSRQAPD